MELTEVVDILVISNRQSMAFSSQQSKRLFTDLDKILALHSHLSVPYPAHEV
jgi:hypothetical protein